MVADVLAAAGGACVVAGVAMFNVPAALVAGGVLLILAAWRLA